ncbi:hypothetical protein K6I34_006702 [Streptomyces sp. UNOC14_S4]|nr:hypothetical protein [Streptomyces sp. UNOC14_S4]
MERRACAELAYSEDPLERAYVAGAPGLPVDLVERLAGDAHSTVRVSAAVNPRLPVHCLPALLADPSDYVAEAAGASPVLPVPWMHELLDRHGVPGGA